MHRVRVEPSKMTTAGFRSWLSCVHFGSCCLLLAFGSMAAQPGHAQPTPVAVRTSKAFVAALLDPGASVVQLPAGTHIALGATLHSETLRADGGPGLEEPITLDRHVVIEGLGEGGCSEQLTCM